MIKSIKVKGDLTTKLSALHEHVFTFTDGLNVIVGPNGIGKTTLLKTLAAHVGIGNGGWSRPLTGRHGPQLPFDPKSVKEVLAAASPGKLVATIDWDGAPVLMQHSGDADQRKFGYFFDSPDESDDGMTDMGLQLSMMTNRFSSGEVRTIKTNQLLQALVKGPPNWPPDATKENSACEKLTGEYLRKVFAAGKGTRNTLLLDEPENSLSIDHQIALWTRHLPMVAGKWQVIVATQNPLPFFLPFVNKVELKTGFAQDIKHQMLDVIMASLQVSAKAKTGTPAAQKVKTRKATKSNE